MARWRYVGLALLVSGAMAFLTGCASLGGQTDASAARLLGWRVDLGRGSVSSYAELDTKGNPSVLGVVFSPTALDGLPTGSDGHHCFDRNKDGVIDPATECNETFEFVIPLPDAVSRRPDIPFKWVMFNWNPHGHTPPGIWDVPHFDVHFYLEPRITTILAIPSGACGPEFVDCKHWEVGRKPIPPNYIHSDFLVGAVSPAMGGHWRDGKDPVFPPEKRPFTRSWLFGGYDGKVIFYENMVTRTFLLSKPDVCDPIKSAKAVALSGFYPTVSCVRYDSKTGEYTISLEKFLLRESSPAEPIAAPK